MSRWRPPATPASKYITPQGYRHMNEELQFLWKTKRPEITRSVQEAAAQGDRSENAEYIYGKKMLREIDARVRFLSRRLDDMVVVDRAPEDTSKVYFGAYVELEEEDGSRRVYRLVGPDESDGQKGWVSVDSPLARALLKKQVDDEVSVEAPSGLKHWCISRIWYDYSETP